MWQIKPESNSVSYDSIENWEKSLPLMFLAHSITYKIVIKNLEGPVHF